MTSKPQITISQIKARAGGKSFSRGESYYHQDAISNPVKRDNTIEAQCRGSYAQPYRVRVEFSNSEIAGAWCNCEYDWGGDCKHIIALLLTYLYEPEKFEAKQPITEILAGKSKDDLISIIEQIVSRYPEIQSIIDRPSPTQVVQGIVELDTLSLRKDLRSAFNSMYEYDYYDYRDYGSHSRHPAGYIQDAHDFAKQFEAKQDWLSASQIYRATLEEFAHMEQDNYHDEDGTLAEEIDRTVSKLKTCLDQDVVITDDNERKAILNALLDVEIWDTEAGGFDIGWESREIILHYAKPDDIPAIREKLEEMKNYQQKRQYGQWAAESYTRFLLDLDVIDAVDPEITLQKLRDEGMTELLIRKLLELERVEEALRVVNEEIATPYELFKIANLFASKDQAHLAQQLVENFLNKQADERLTHWMVDYYQQQKNVDKTLHWERVLMRVRPTDDLYLEIKHNAKTLNQWEIIQPEIITELKQGKHFNLLTRLYLIEEEWELAWQTLPEARKEPRNWMYGQAIELEVADATRHIMPDRAISIYKDRIQQNIDARGRDNYAQAAAWLVIVRKLYRDLKEQETWNHLIKHIRTEYKRLPALQDELNKAGL